MTVTSGPTIPRPSAACGCLNCGTILHGAWCHACGQHGGSGHRSLLHLGAELLETLTHADSRLWRTMRRLALDPARLTQDYLDGRRASEIPPLRLFFVMLFLLFGIGSLTHGSLDMPRLDPATSRTIHQKLDRATLPGGPHVAGWLRAHAARAVDNPAEVLSVMRDWAERFTILMLPVAALALWALHPPWRRFGLYDHTILAIHSLCFVSLVLIATFLGALLLDGLAAWLLLLLPLHLFVHMRGVYGTSIAGTLLRMAVLGGLSLVGLSLLLLGLAGLGLELGAGA